MEKKRQAEPCSGPGTCSDQLNYDLHHTRRGWKWPIRVDRRMPGVNALQNSSILKLTLFCEGMRLSPQANELLNEGMGREIMRTRAGLGSGLELVLTGGYHVNVPVCEAFAEQSSLCLDNRQGRWVLVSRDGESVEVQLAPRPAWYDRSCSSGKKMTQIGTLQGTYLGIYPTKVCEFWQGSQKENCAYCSVGLNLGLADAEEKRLEEILETIQAAREESGITYVDFNTGHYADQSYLDVLEPILKQVKRRTGLLLGIQTPPHEDLDRYRRLKDLGVNRVSFCFELYNPERFRQVCPGKARVYGLERYLKTMDFCASLGARQTTRQPWVTNGEIIAGLEEPRYSEEAIDRICSVGAIPTVCVFRPLIGTAMEQQPPPRTEEMIPVFRHLYEACMERGLPIGLAPNIHVSLVLTPDECVGLSSRSFAWQRMKNRAKGLIVRRNVYGNIRKACAAIP